MLVLTRRPGESIQIGEDIVITVVWTTTGQVRLGITAPRDMAVTRPTASPVLRPAVPPAGQP